MYNETMDAIRNNPFLKDLEDAVAQFGMYGIFLWEHRSEQIQDKGFYFLCGHDRQTVDAAADQLEELYALQRSRKSIRLDLHICKVTDRSAFNVHQEVMEYCLWASTMRFLFNWAGLTNVPLRISSTFLQVVLALYERSQDPSLDMKEKAQQEKLLKHYLLIQGEQERLTGGERLPSEAHGKPEKIDKNAPGKQKALPDLLCSCISTVSKTLPYNDLPLVLEALAKKPHLQYFQAKPVVPKVPLPGTLLHRTEKCEDLASVTFVIDAWYEKEFDLIRMSRYQHTKGTYLRNKRIDHCRFGIRQEDLPAVYQRAKAAGIIIALDQENPYFNYIDQLANIEKDGYAFVCALKDVERLDSVLLDMAKHSREQRILCDAHLKQEGSCIYV